MALRAFSLRERKDQTIGQVQTNVEVPAEAESATSSSLFVTGIGRATLEATLSAGQGESRDWTSERRSALARLALSEWTGGTPWGPQGKDCADWSRVASSPVADVAEVIRSRGMNFMLAGRIQVILQLFTSKTPHGFEVSRNVLGFSFQGFLRKVEKDFGKIDLQWLLSAPPEVAQ